MASNVRPPKGSIYFLLTLICVCHLVLALVFASETPYLTAGVSNGQKLADIGAPDERAHVLYVQHVMNHRSMPVLAPGSDTGEYESHQPPLYYALVAGWVQVMDQEDVMHHSSAMAVRSLNPFFGAAAVAGIFFFALWAYGSQRVAIVAAGVAGLLPMMAALSGAVSNDPLTIALATWSLAVMAKFRHDWKVWSAILVGCLVGLTVLTKLTGLLLVPALVLLFWFVKPRPKPSIAIAALATIAVLISPLLIRNQMVYGHPLALNAFYAYFPRQVDPKSLLSPYALAHWFYVLASGTLLSFVGEFGYMDIQLPMWMYAAILIPLIACLVAAIMRHNKSVLRIVTVMFVGLLTASYLSYNLWQVQPQARYLFPAMAPIALWIACGLKRLTKDRMAIAASLMLLLLLGADIYALSILSGEFSKRTQAIPGQTGG